MNWKTLLAYITETVDQELLLRNAYLVIENRTLRNQIKGRVRLSDGEHKTLAEIGYKLGKQALEKVAKMGVGKELCSCGALHCATCFRSGPFLPLKGSNLIGV